MPNEITNGYQIECLLCSYVWKTKYSQISAKCPSCNSRIYGTENYTVKTRYVHYEKTEEEKKQTIRNIGMNVLGLFIFISLITGWFFGFFLFTIILGLWVFIIRNESKTIKANENSKNEK